MAIYDGFISLGEDQVHVILSVEENTVTLSSNGAEIGEWGSDEVSIRYMSKGVYTLTAEEETLEFVPNDQDLFAIRFGEIDDHREEARREDLGRHARAGEPPAGARAEPSTIRAAPPPRPVTKVIFYALAGVTALLGLWAIVSMVVG